MARRKKQNEEESQENRDNINSESDDTFGLPEIEYEPINRKEPEPEVREEEVSAPEYAQESTVEQETVEERGYTPTYFDDEEPPSVWPKILGIGALLLIVAAGVWFFWYYRPQQLAAEKARQEEAARQRDADAKAEMERRAEEQRAADEKRRADSLANAVPAVGMVEALSERTGRYYVVIASAIDDDLIIDYANKLSKDGVSSKIIPPFRKTKFSRLAIDSKDTYAEAQAAADALKGGNYGNEVWVVKY
jgi:hypothetical protein